MSTIDIHSDHRRKDVGRFRTVDHELILVEVYETAEEQLYEYQNPCKYPIGMNYFLGKYDLLMNENIEDSCCFQFQIRGFHFGNIRTDCFQTFHFEITV